MSSVYLLCRRLVLSTGSDLRHILGQIWAHVLPRPEVFICTGPSNFMDGKLTDASTRKFLTDLLTAFKPWIERMRVKK